MNTLLRNMPSETPTFTLGQTNRRILTFSVLTAASMITAVLLYIFTNTVAGTFYYSVVTFSYFFLGITFVLCFLITIALLLVRFRHGILYLFESKLTWNMKGRSRTLGYEDLKNAYIGAMGGAAKGNNNYLQGGSQSFAFVEVASFYIDDVNFVFKDRQSDSGMKLTEFLENKIPHENIDVDDLSDEGD